MIFFYSNGQTLKKNQFISFDQIGNKSCIDSILTLSAIASSDLTITYEINGPATVLGNTLRLKNIIFKPGSVQTTVIITARQDGNDEYNPATPVTRTFDVKPIFFDSLNGKVLVNTKSFYCEGDTVVIVPKDIATIKYEWTFPDNSLFLSKNIVLNNISSADSGIYNLNIYEGVCKLIGNYITVNVHTKPDVIWKNPVDTIESGTVPFKFQFVPRNGQFFVNNVVQSDTTFNFKVPGVYDFNYLVLKNGCSGSYSGRVALKKSEPIDSLIVVYKIITPNDDNKNDFFYIDNIDKYPDNQVIVCDLWGNTVYEASGYKNTWEPKDIANGNYFYVLTINKPVIKKLTGNLLVTK